MSDKTNRWTSGAFARRLILLPALLVAVSVAFTGAASAQTAFQANTATRQIKPAGPCSNGAAICGTANLAGYGAASWDFYFTGFMPGPTACGDTYSAEDFFTLSDGSTLALAESGNICYPGKDGAGFFSAPFGTSYGGPINFNGTWTVDTGNFPPTGQFAGLSGSGTDVIRGAGAHALGSYTGTLGA
jgi:hypothetical protein